MAAAQIARCRRPSAVNVANGPAAARHVDRLAAQPPYFRAAPKPATQPWGCRMPIA